MPNRDIAGLVLTLAMCLVGSASSVAGQNSQVSAALGVPISIESLGPQRARVQFTLPQNQERMTIEAPGLTLSTTETGYLLRATGTATVTSPADGRAMISFESLEVTLTRDLSRVDWRGKKTGI